MYATATSNNGSNVSVVTDESIVSAASAAETAKSPQTKRRRLSSHLDCKNLPVVSHDAKPCDRVAIAVRGGRCLSHGAKRPSHKCSFTELGVSQQCSKLPVGAHGFCKQHSGMPSAARSSAFGGAEEKPKNRGPGRSVHCSDVDVGGSGLQHGFSFWPDQLHGFNLSNSQQTHSSRKSIQELESNFMLALQQPSCLPPVAQRVRKREVETIDKKKTHVAKSIAPDSLKIALARIEERNDKLRVPPNSDGHEQDTSMHDAELLLGLSAPNSSFFPKAAKGTPGSMSDTTTTTNSCSESFESSASNYPTGQHEVLQKDATTGIVNKMFPELRKCPRLCVSLLRTALTPLLH